MASTVQPSELPVLHSQRLYKRIAEVLEERIRSGAFSPGAYLPPERDLASQMRVSRTSVREALIALEIKGLLTVRVGDGVQVCEPHTPSDLETAEERSVLEQLHARSLIEGELTAVAAKNAKPKHISALSANVAAMEKAVADPVRFLNFDRDFHFAIAEATGNQVLVDQLEHLWALRRQPTYRKFEEHYLASEDEQRAILADHRKIVSAIHDRKAAEARTAMKAHLRRVERFFMR
jgi:DNA-binding FadR family transcriptional regulator